MSERTTEDGNARLHTLLYVSEMREPDAGVVAGICHQSRDNNLRHDITGLLVFDGHAFCQFVEGTEAAITSLHDRLEHDPRHVNMRVLQFGAATARGRRFASWRLGYAFSADPAAIARLATARDDDALLAFDRLLPNLVERS